MTPFLTIQDKERPYDGRTVFAFDSKSGKFNKHWVPTGEKAVKANKIEALSATEMQGRLLTAELCGLISSKVFEEKLYFLEALANEFNAKVEEDNKVLYRLGEQLRKPIVF